jgi:hypothetical protein
MVIEDWDRSFEGQDGGLGSIGSTKQGAGAALARKILNRGSKPMLGDAVRLAKDHPDLVPYVKSVQRELDDAYTYLVHTRAFAHWSLLRVQLPRSSKMPFGHGVSTLYGGGILALKGSSGKFMPTETNPGFERRAHDDRQCVFSYRNAYGNVMVTADGKPCNY